MDFAAGTSNIKSIRPHDVNVDQKKAFMCSDKNQSLKADGIINAGRLQTTDNAYLIPGRFYITSTSKFLSAGRVIGSMSAVT